MCTHFATMEQRALVILFVLLFVSPISSETAAEDPLIRQVVDGGGNDDGGGVHWGPEEHQFSVFKRRFGKAYSSKEEHDYRFEVFKANLRRAKRHQRLDPSAVHGVTRFSDMEGKDGIW